MKALSDNNIIKQFDALGVFWQNSKALQGQHKNTEGTVWKE